MEPTIELLKKLPEIVARQWEERNKRITTNQTTLNKRLAEHERFNSQAIKQKTPAN
jgi:hypothetical protein